MKNIDIDALVKAGFTKLNYKGLEPTAGFKVVRFNSELRKAYAALEEERVGIIKETLGDKLEAFEEHNKWLQSNKEGELPEKALSEEEYNAALEEITPLIKELYNAEGEVKLNPLTFEQYMKLAEINEDKNLFDPIVTEAMEGVLWEE